MTENREKPLLLAFYGDDFSGSTDVLEALSRAGLKTALFLEPPTAAQIADRAMDAIGVAGISRSLPVEKMEAELRPVFEALRALQPRLVHYKICSTFDSSPHIGSIGRALDIGQSTLNSPYVPLVVGAPILGRYCVFGNLFARSGGESEPFRLDLHPTMRQHPTTPMTESDLRLHLSQQTDKSIGLFDVLSLDSPPDKAQLVWKQLVSSCQVLLFDTLYENHLPVIGRLIWENADAPNTLFCVGSSGVEYALAAHWKTDGMLSEVIPTVASEVEQVVAVSGSCSPVTASQIEWAIGYGWAEVALQTEILADAAHCEEGIFRAAQDAIKVLSSGRSVVLHACRGPQDKRLDATHCALKQRSDGRGSAEIIGCALGRILHTILRECHRPRVAVTGGDTSGFVARTLGIESLEFISSLYSGSPLCRARTSETAVDGIEIVFKGGQVGRTDFFECVRRGHI